MEKTKLTDLTNGVLSKLRELNYSQATINGYKAIYNVLIDYAKSISVDTFSEELGVSFLEKFSSFRYRREDKKVSLLGARGEYAASAIRKLGELQQCKSFSRRAVSVKIEHWAMDDYQIMLAFDHSCAPVDDRKTPASDRLKRLRKFYLHLELIGLRSIRFVTPDIISNYLKTEAGYSKVTIKSLHKSLRQYFRFLHTYGYLPIDYSGYVPRVQAIRNANIPMLWSNDDVEKLLASIDLASPCGKRNYAIFLLVAELGIRACDVNALKCRDIDWNKKEIHFIQEKTGSLNVVPLSDRVGWAIINYIQYSRPKVDSPYVFLTCNAPFQKMGLTTAISALKTQMRIAGIKPQHPKAHAGIHSLRHSLARKLLDHNVPLEDIADILGHSEISSSSPYLKIDVEGLRECALSLEEGGEYV